jgi:DNA-directed RNA polymerase
MEKDKIPTVTVPILFDASCSGIQHLSAMTRDIIIARKVNTLPNEGLDDALEEEILDKALPQDYYNYAAINVQLELDKETNILSNIKLTRNLIKRTVMTIPYNITLKGVEKQFKEHFILIKEGSKYFFKVPAIYTKTNENTFLLPTEFSKLIKIIYNNLIIIPSLTELSEYLNSLMNILLKLNQPIIWNTPVGLKINLSSMQFKAIETKSQILKSSKPITIRLPLTQTATSTVL